MNKNLIIKIILLYINLITCFQVNGQSNRNSISIFYTPQITRSYFIENITSGFFGPFIEFIETAPSNRPIMGYSYGIDYTRYFKKFHLGIYLQENLRGQRSSFAYNYRSVMPVDTLEGYGGIGYNFRIKSINLGLNVGYNLSSHNDYNSDLQLSFGIDIFETSFMQDFIIQSEDGILTSGCCGDELVFYPAGYLQNILNRFNRGYYRADFGISWRNYFKLFNNFYLELNPQVRFLTKILKPDKAVGPYILDGIIWSVGIQTGLSYHF